MIEVSHFPLFCFFFSLLETRSKKHLPCQVLIQYLHGNFNYLNHVFLMLVACHYSIQEQPCTVKRVGTNSSFSMMISHVHLNKPTFPMPFIRSKNWPSISRLILHSSTLKLGFCISLNIFTKSMFKDDKKKSKIFCHSSTLTIQSN